MHIGMTYYTMKALTPDDDWYAFTLADIPVPISDNTFVLITKPNTPHLRMDTIRRGDSAMGLYEGDVIEMDGCKWLVCYERGFYVINEDYVSKHFSSITDYRFVGTIPEVHINVPIRFKERLSFKYGEDVFALRDIVGAYNGKAILRRLNEPIDASLLMQECCCTYEGKKLFLGDHIDGGVIELIGGRIVLHKDDTFTDVVTGGTVYGCNPKHIG